MSMLSTALRSWVGQERVCLLSNLHGTVVSGIPVYTGVYLSPKGTHLDIYQYLVIIYIDNILSIALSNINDLYVTSCSDYCFMHF